MIAGDQLLESSGIVRAAAVVENFSRGIQKNCSGNAGHLIALGQVLLLVDVDSLEAYISKFWNCCVKHGRKCYARVSPLGPEFVNLLDL